MAAGAALRMVLHFEPDFFESLPDFDFLFGGGISRTFWASPREVPAIVAWSGGPAARELSRRPEGERVEIAVGSLAAALGLPEPVLAQNLLGWYHHDWLTHPFPRGAYSYVTVGGGERLAELGTVRGALVLAGEHVGRRGDRVLHGRGRAAERRARGEATARPRVDSRAGGAMESDEALRLACQPLYGHGWPDPAAELEAAAAWCRAGGVRSDVYGKGEVMRVLRGQGGGDARL